MLKLILDTGRQFRGALDSGCSLPDLVALPIMEKTAKMKFTEENNLTLFDTYQEDLKKEVSSLINKGTS